MLRPIFAMIVIVGAFVLPSEGFSQTTFVCSVEGRFPATPKLVEEIRIEFEGERGPIRVFDPVGARVGQRFFDGRYVRKVGGNHLIEWRADLLPRDLLPREQRRYFAPTALFKVRLDKATGAMRSTTVYTANQSVPFTQFNKGRGNCERR